MLGNLGLLHQQAGRAQEAQEHYAQAAAIHRDRREAELEGTLQMRMGNLWSEQVDPARARVHLARARSLFRRIGARKSEALVLESLGLLAVELGHPERAEAHYAQAQAIYRALEEPHHGLRLLGNIGDLLASQGDLAGAAHALQQVVTTPVAIHPMIRGAFLGSLAGVRARQDAGAEAWTLVTRGEALLRGQSLVELAKLLCKKAEIAHRAGNAQAAGEALTEAETLAIQLQTPAGSELDRALVGTRAAVRGGPD